MLAGPPIDWAGLARVLVVRADNLGDVLMCGPAVRALRRAAPRARLTLLAAPAGAAAAPLLPEVDDVLAASVSWQQLDPGAMPPGDDLDLVARVAAGRYDAAVILTSFSQSPWPAGYVCRLAGVPIRIGMSREFGGAGLTHWVPAAPDTQHQADRALYLLAQVGVARVDGRLRARPPAGAAETARNALHAHGLPPGAPYALLLPGASCPSRRYPAGRFAAVARLLHEGGLATVVAGTANEAPLVREVCATTPGAVAVTGALDVPALAAAAAASRVVVCNNSGGAHLASALSVPVVVLFAGTERPPEYRPRYTPAAVLTEPVPCSPCRQLTCPYAQECLDVAPERVAAEALRLAARTASGRGRSARGGVGTSG